MNTFESVCSSQPSESLHFSTNSVPDSHTDRSCFDTCPAVRNFQPIIGRPGSMLFIFLSTFSQSEVIEFTERLFEQQIGGSKTIFVKFYSSKCGGCRIMAQEFEDASNYFKDVMFANVNCAELSKLCKNHAVEGYPRMKLFKPRDRKGVVFSGSEKADAFADFIEHHTALKGRRSGVRLLQLTPFNFEKIIRSKSCALVRFYFEYRDDLVLRDAANVYRSENVTVGALNCEKFKGFCDEMEIKRDPTIKLSKSGKWIEFDKTAKIETIVEFVNTECETERGVNGLLNDRAGTIAAADTIAQAFLNANDRVAIIEKIKQIPGTEFYVKVMERILEKGEEQIRQDIKEIWLILGKRKGSIETLDGLKRRYNVFRKFIPDKTDL